MLSRASSSNLDDKVTGCLKVPIADDTAFTSTRFQVVLRRNYITHREQSREDIATLTRFIGVIRRALAVTGDVNWAETIQQVVSKHNKSPHRKLFGTVKPSVSDLPGDAKSDDHKREELQAARGFRVLLKAKRLNRRARVG